MSRTVRLPWVVKVGVANRGALAKDSRWRDRLLNSTFYLVIRWSYYSTA